MAEDKKKDLKNSTQDAEGCDLTIEPLIAALKDNDPVIREDAVEILERIGKPAVDPLIKTLKIKAADVRRYAVRVLGNIADSRAVSSLIRRLKDKEPEVRKETAEALGKIGDSSAIKSLVNALKDKNSAVRGKAAAALDQIGWEPANNNELSLYAVAKKKWSILPFLGQTAVEPLIDVIKSKEQQDQDRAAAGSGKIVDIAADPGFDFRKKAADVLDAIGWQPGNKTEAAIYHLARQDWDELLRLGKDAVEPLIFALKDRDPGIRTNAARTLSKIGDSKAVVPLINAMNDEEETVRGEVVTALGKIVDPGAVKHLLTALEDPRYNTERVIDALGEKGDPAAVEYLTGVLEDTTWEARKSREAAARALGRIGDVKAVDPLIDALDSSYYEVRKEAAEALGKIADIRAAVPLITALNDDNANFREIVVNSLCNIMKPKIAGPLVNVLGNKNNVVRKGAADVLSEIGWEPADDTESAIYLTAKQEWDELPAAGAHAVPALIAVLKDENPEIRSGAVRTLGKIGHPGAVESLIAALKDQSSPDSYIREIIAALGEIGDVRALAHLSVFLNDYLEDSAKEALKKISGNVCDKDLNFLCSKCFQRAQENKIEYPVYENNAFWSESIIYYACRNCHSNSYLVKEIEKVVLLLDRDAADAYVQEGKVLTVNWIKNRSVFDFDEIRIKDAADSDVEELVTKLRNAPDDKRLKPLAAIPVYLSPGLKLSPDRINLLKDNFNIEVK